MGKQYVVTVFEVDTADDSETTLVELRAPVEMLRQFAPAAVAAALGASVQETDDGLNGAPGVVESAEPRTRAKRRTKAARTEEAQAAVQSDLSTGDAIPGTAEATEAPKAYSPFG